MIETKVQPGIPKAVMAQTGTEKKKKGHDQAEIQIIMKF
jgi:hypothetical protein